MLHVVCCESNSNAIISYGLSIEEKTYKTVKISFKFKKVFLKLKEKFFICSFITKF